MWVKKVTYSITKEINVKKMENNVKYLTGNDIYEQINIWAFELDRAKVFFFDVRFIIFRKNH